MDAAKILRDWQRHKARKAEERARAAERPVPADPAEAARLAEAELRRQVEPESHDVKRSSRRWLP